MKKILTTALLCSQFAIATHMCAQHEPEERHAICGNKGPDENYEEWFQARITDFKNSPASRNNAVITIPVIVHILYKTGQAVGKTPNITAEQVQSQITFLNKMMDGTDPNKSKLPSAFKSVDGGDTQIQFCLAVKDPNGNVLQEPGIERLNLTQKGWDDPSQITTYDQLTNLFDGQVKPSTIWDPTKYLNIWTGDFTNKSYYLGYAKFPVGTGLSGLDSELATAKNDGVVMGSNVFGCKTYYPNGYYFTEPYIYGVTTAHEVGHWLGLRHISGDQACGNDYCTDTPPQKGGNNKGPNGLNWGCPTSPFQVNGCGSGQSPNGEMFQNYMDYSDDQCRSLFTKDQVTRIKTAMQYGTRRSTLGKDDLCNSNTPAKAAFSADKTDGCGSLTVQFKDESQGSPTSWKWDFGDGSGTSTQQNPSYTYTKAGIFDVTLTSSNSFGGTPVTKSKYITVGTGKLFTAVKGGPIDYTSVGGGGYFATNSDRGLLFEVLNPAIIESFKVFASGAGERTIELLDGVGGNSLQSKTINMADGESRVAVGFSVDKGKYFVKISGSKIDLYRNNAGAKFPYAIADLINITQTDYAATDPNFYYYFYDWEVRKAGCDVSNGTVDEKYTEAAIQLYPNPSKGDLTITLPASGRNTDVVIYNLVGEIVFRNEAANNRVLTVDLANQANGMYFVSVKAGNVITTRKFVLAK